MGLLVGWCADGWPSVKYGDIYRLKPDPIVGSEQAGRRLGLVISADEAIEVIPTVVTVVPLTTRRRERVACVPVTGPGLQEPSWGLCDQVGTVSVLNPDQFSVRMASEPRGRTACDP